MTTHGAREAERDERRWVVVGLAVAFAALLAQVVVGSVRDAFTGELSARERVETCLTERVTPFEAVTDDAVALSAERGTLRTTVQGNRVTVVLGGSEGNAERIVSAYESVGSPGPRLERLRKVVLLWDRPPTAAQRDFMTLCTLDVQD